VSILPVAAYHFSIAQKRNLQPKLAYSIFLVSLLGILGTSVPRTFLAHQFQFDSNQPPKLTVIQSGVHEIASRFGLTCHRCDPRDPYRLYASERISLETNFNIESNILYMNASEFNRSEPSSLSKEITLPLSNKVSSIAENITTGPYDRRSKREHQFKTRLRFQKNGGGYPFSIGCSRDSQLRDPFDALDEYAQLNGFTLAYSGEEDALYRSYYAGQVTGPFMTSRTTSIQMTGQCRIGGWTIDLVIQQTTDRTVDARKLLLELKNLLELRTGQNAQVEQELR
jgi:hypothetical protein